MKGKKIIEEAEAVAVIRSAEFVYVNPDYKGQPNEGKLVLDVAYKIVNSRRGGRLALHSKEDLDKFFLAYGINYGFSINQEQINRLKNELMVLHERYENREKRQAKGEWVHPVESSFVKEYDIDDESVYDFKKEEYKKYENLSVMKD
tara:strand:- start:1375 stop:1815 length:441 start_codon:yes stop_codon:yes gene_type:complete